MAASRDEAKEIRRGKTCRGVVPQRVAIHLVEGGESRVYHDEKPEVGVIDKRERRDRAGRDAENRHELFRASKAETSHAISGASALRSTRVSSFATTSASRPALSFRKRFLVCAPGSVPRSACDSSTVNIGACSTVTCGIPSASRRANNVVWLAGMEGISRAQGRPTSTAGAHAGTLDNAEMIN